jgi:HK97 family phage prohead protease
MQEKKSISLEFKDLDTGKREAVIAHAVYDNIDRTGDISCKGMFTKSWAENKNIDFLFNHVDGDVVGSVKGVFEDEKKAYTKVGFGNWTLGNDVLEMADAGVLKGASFKYETEQKEFVNIKGKKIRKLKEVKHYETSLLTLLPANPLAGIVSLTKSFTELELKKLSAVEQSAIRKILMSDQDALRQLVELSLSLDSTSDMYIWINYNISRRAESIADLRREIKYNSDEINGMKSYVKLVDKFCRDANASDETIIKLSNDITEVKKIIEEFDTATTGIANQPGVSKSDIQTILQALKN